MGRRTFDVVDLTELFVHWEAGRSQVQISESLNLDRKTVRKFLAPALADGLLPGGAPVGGADQEADQHQAAGQGRPVGDQGARPVVPGPPVAGGGEISRL